MNKKKILIIICSIILIITAFIVGVTNRKTNEITYEIFFETLGGTSVEAQIVEKGNKIIKPVDPVKEGYIFVEWIYQDKAYDFSSEVTSNITLTAKWVEISETKTFVVKFETDGGTTISNQIIEEGNKIAKPIDPIKEGYVFKGWLLNDEIYNFDLIVEKNIELKAKWEKEIDDNTSNNNNNSSSNDDSDNAKPQNPVTPVVKKYTVTFDSNGGTNVSSQTITEGSKAKKPTNPTKNGYNFEGWLLNGKNYDFNQPITSNITLVAKWNQKAKYTVTFDSNGGTNVSSQTITEGSKATKPTNPTKNGYNFGGWLLNGKNYDFNQSVTSNITLVAKWNQKTYTIKVTSIDQYSPDRILTVYEDGKQINVSAIKYNGVTLCSGSNMVVNMYEINGIDTVTVVLTNGSSVTASVQ